MADDELNDGAARVRLLEPFPWTGWSLVPLSGAFWAMFTAPAFLFLPSDMERHGTGFWATLWHTDNSGAAWMATVASAAYLALIVLVVRSHVRRRAVREVAVTMKGLTLTRHRKAWRPARTWSVEWEQVRCVSAWRGWFGEATPSRHNSRRVLRPGLDVYLYAEVDGADRWVYTENRKAKAPELGDGPAPWVRIGAAGVRAQESMVQLARGLGRIRPDVFYRGTDLEQWYTPPGVVPEEAAPAAAAPGAPTAPSNPTGQPTSSQPTEPVVVDMRESPRRWATIIGVLTAGTFLSSLGIHTGLWYPVVVSLSALALLIFGPLLVLSLWSAPLDLTRRQIRVGPRGLEFELRPLLWSWHKVDAVVPWEQVRAVLERTVSGARGEQKLGSKRDVAIGDYLYALDIYVDPRRTGDATAWRKLGVEVDRCREPDAPELEPLVGFPATRIRMTCDEDMVERTAREWQEMDDGGPVPATVSLFQLGRAVRLFRPDLVR
ncbi:hypothetical protein [Nocardiopsis oceani]